MTRTQKAQKRVDELREEEQTLDKQSKRHRSHGESDTLIRKELSRTRGELYNARRELKFSQRIAP